MSELKFSDLSITIEDLPSRAKVLSGEEANEVFGGFFRRRRRRYTPRPVRKASVKKISKRGSVSSNIAKARSKGLKTIDLNGPIYSLAYGIKFDNRVQLGRFDFAYRMNQIRRRRRG